jgi:hypothetical protein
MMQVDLKLSPYLFPLRDIETFATRTWPLMTTLWPPRGTWIRSNYFQLRESVEPHVHFDLVGAIGDFCSIPLEVKRWQACALEVRMFDPAAPRRAHIRRKQVEIEDGIGAKLASARWIAIWMQQHELPADSLLRTTFDAWNEPDETDRKKEPDGLWILQINQDRFDFSRRIAEARDNARSGEELWHRRDTLSGNLSLNQEVAFIEAVKQRLDDPGQRFRPHDKPIEVVRIVMDSEAVGAAVGKELGLFSQFDRNPALEQSLLAHGRDQARNFLALRGDGNRLWDELAYALEAMGARPSPRFEMSKSRAAILVLGGECFGTASVVVLDLNRLNFSGRQLPGSDR